MRLRRSVFTLSVIIGLILVVLPGGLHAADQSTWKVGTAQAVITPEKPLLAAGYGSRHGSVTDKLHDIWIKVLALQAADGTQAVVVTSDVLGFPKAMADKICVELQNRCDLKRSQIMLTSSHTHTGPVLQGALYDIYELDDNRRAAIKEYSLELERKVVDKVALALDKLSSATLWATEGHCDVAVNRRNYRGKDVAKLRRDGVTLEGPFDHDVPVLIARGPDGKPRACVFGYACHCTTLNFRVWSGDYAGYAQLELQKQHPNMLAMFYAGCGADQNPLPRRTLELCKEYGSRLATSVEVAMKKPMRPISPQLRAAYEVIQLDFDKRPTRDFLETSLNKKGPKYVKRWAARFLKQLDNSKELQKSYPYPLQVWRLGKDQLWIVMGGEVVVDYSLLFKKEFGPKTWVTAYANDVMAYIPSARVRNEGGYEAGAFRVYGLPAITWTPEIEERINACVKRLVEKTK